MGGAEQKGVEFDLIWLLPALAVLPLFYVLGAVGWDLILRFLGYRLSPVRAQVAWGQPLLARYVPGSVLYLLGRLVLSERAGVPRRITLASIVYEQAISVASGVAFATYFLIGHPDLQGQPLRWAVLLVVPAAIVVLSPRVFGPLSARLLRAFGREPLPETLPLRGVITMLLFYALNWASRRSASTSPPGRSTTSHRRSCSWSARRRPSASSPRRCRWSLRPGSGCATPPSPGRSRWRCRAAASRSAR